MTNLTVIGHACLHVDTGGPTILVDPWLLGSAFWRSWWHYPPSPRPRAEWLAPDYLYVTHHHFDHFHYPSMRKIDKAATVLLPRFGVDVMAGEVRALGFTDVRELPHGEVEVLDQGVRVASFQYGPDDSAFVIDSHGTVIVDLNDCKIRGMALAAVRDTFGPADVVLKSHSWAQAYPFNYTAEDPADLAHVQRETYLRDFVDIVGALDARYAIPFGSMVAFLHPESRAVNEHLITPDDVRAYAGSVGAPFEVVTMAPGDSWDDEDGFTRARRDWYAERPERLVEMVDDIQPRLEAQTELESSRELDFDAFAAYLHELMEAVPRPLWRRAVPRPIVFEVPSAPEPWWVVDFARRAVWRSVRLPERRASVVHVTEGLLADAIDKRILHLVHGAVRVHVDLRPGGFNEDTAFWTLLMAWELGYLPLRRSLSPRLLSVAWRRRREALDYLAALRGSGTVQERMLARFATVDDADATSPTSAPPRPTSPTSST